jgi:hypothetical protein
MLVNILVICAALMGSLTAIGLIAMGPPNIFFSVALATIPVAMGCLAASVIVLNKRR